MKFRIRKTVRKYLEVQRGGISHLVGKKGWEAAYEDSIEADFESIKPVLPTECRNLLDVGGGMSGLGIRLHRHYKATNPVLAVDHKEVKGDYPMIAVLDGLYDPPVVKKHWHTFNSSLVTRDFAADNGVSRCWYITPDEDLEEFKWSKFQLVVSTQAWCFHFPPALYMEKVKLMTYPGAIIVLDVRIGKDWMKELHANFEVLGGLVSRDKWVRTAFRRRERDDQ